MSFRKRNVVLSSSAAPGESSPQQRSQPEAALPMNRNAAGTAHLRGAPGSAASLRTPADAVRLPIRPSPGSGPGPARAPSGTAQPSAPKVKLPPVTWKTASTPPISAEELAKLEPEMRKLNAQLEAERLQRRHPKPVIPLDRGARPSPFDGRPITSTGTASVDQLLAGYGGLVLGHSILIQELGTTDFSSVLLRAYAAEGLVQGHHVHVLGFGPGWRTELPGIASASSSSSRSAKAKEAADSNDKMKIAWRYEALSARPTPNAGARSGPAPGPSSASPVATFCHAFDLTKRLAPTDIKGTLHAFPLPNPLRPSPQPEHVYSPLRKFLASIKASLDSTPPSSIHRVVLPNFLAPTLYAMDGWTFPYVIALMAGLRAMLRDYNRRLTAMISMSTSLYSHDNECVFRLETLCDNIAELIPLPPGPPSAVTASNKPSGEKASPADKMQGWFKVHKLQVYSELGGGGTGPQGKPLTENLCFSVSGHKGLVVTPYSLPPIEDMTPKEKSSADTKKDDMEF